MKKVEINHADIVVTHLCNNHCPYCIDKFVNTDKKLVSLRDVDSFCRMLKKYTDKRLTILLLGGEPTTAPLSYLIDIATIVHSFGYNITMSTNGILKDKIIKLLSYFDSIQITINNFEELEFWNLHKNQLNIKLAGDNLLNIDRLETFIRLTDGFYRKSISMYFTPNWEEVCKDEGIWELFNTLDWVRSGSYEYTFYKGVRIKRCIYGETNIIDEPDIPKLYPNGVYNKTWLNEDADYYLGELL